MKIKLFFQILVLGCALSAMPFSALGADNNTITGRILTKGTKTQMATGAAADQGPIMVETIITLFALPAGKIVADTAPDAEGVFTFTGVEPGEYMIQVVAPNHIVSKAKVTVGGGSAGAAQPLEIILRRPIDPGKGSQLKEIPEERGGTAGVNHAFGCVSISLVFVEFQGSNTWSATEITDSETAAQTAMTSFESIAPPGARITTHVENFGTYTVTNPVGNWCADADLWVDEILTQAGYTTGTLDARIAALSNDRRDANCGTNPTCSTCGPNSSSFLFFITRDDSTMWGGWNCNNRYLISYWNRYDEAVVYMHEVGHGFGADDEYCVPNQNYCCGWVTGTWGCTSPSGCLNATNDNCDPACGSNCNGGSGSFVDCQDGCPAANCTSHTNCAMDGSGTLSYCPATRRQIGWVDTDGDGALDCTETACGSNPNSPGDVPPCVNQAPAADAGGPYIAECGGAHTTVSLNGTGSSDPDGAPLTYSWSTDCPGGTFNNSAIAQPTLTVNTSSSCSVNCTVSLTVTDDFGVSNGPDTANVTVHDTTPPVIVCPTDRTIQCTESSDPSNTGTATVTDSCISDPPVTYSDTTAPGTCPQASRISRSWTATDLCGNTASCMQRIDKVDTTAPVLSPLPPDVTVECSAVPPPAVVSATDNCDPSVSVSFNEQRIDGSCAFNYSLIRTWSASDDCGNTATHSQTVTIQDTTPPNIKKVTVSPDVLWPPNHRMVPVTVKVLVSDNCDLNPTCKIISVASNEPENGLGDGDMAPDWRITGDFVAFLRAERSGTGSGRVYTIGVACIDTCGNTSTSNIIVTVPHDQSK